MDETECQSQHHPPEVQPEVDETECQSQHHPPEVPTVMKENDVRPPQGPTWATWTQQEKEQGHWSKEETLSEVLS